MGNKTQGYGFSKPPDGLKSKAEWQKLGYRIKTGSAPVSSYNRKLPSPYKGFQVIDLYSLEQVQAKKR